MSPPTRPHLLTSHTRQGDPTAHAELLCIRAGAAALGGGWQALGGATLYCTLEPCAMCAGALLQARVGCLVWGAPSPGGADGSWVRLLGGGGEAAAAAPWQPHHTHPRVVVRRGVLAEESGQLLRAFFRRRRAQGAAAAAGAAGEGAAGAAVAGAAAALAAAVG